jgi:hypothetical protein
MRDFITYTDAVSEMRADLAHKNHNAETRHPIAWKEYCEWRLSQIPVDDKERQGWWATRQREKVVAEHAKDIDSWEKRETAKRFKRMADIIADDRRHYERRLVVIKADG